MAVAQAGPKGAKPPQLELLREQEGLSSNPSPPPVAEGSHQETLRERVTRPTTSSSLKWKVAHISKLQHKRQDVGKPGLHSFLPISGAARQQRAGAKFIPRTRTSQVRVVTLGSECPRPPAPKALAGSSASTAREPEGHTPPGPQSLPGEITGQPTEGRGSSRGRRGTHPSVGARQAMCVEHAVPVHKGVSVSTRDQQGWELTGLHLPSHRWRNVTF